MGKVVTFYTQLNERLFRPGLAALVPDQPWPSDLAQALDNVVKVIQSWMQGPVKVAGLPHLTGLHLSAEGATHHFGRVSKAQAGQTLFDVGL